MKLIIVWLCAFACWAEETNAPVIVEYTTTEKDYSSGFRFAIACATDEPGCGIPVIEVTHFQKCASVQEAVEFIAGGMGADWNPMVTVKQPRKPTLVAVYSLTELPIEKTVTVTETPQPPLKTEAVQYSVAGVKPKPKPKVESITSGTWLDTSGTRTVSNPMINVH